VEVEEKQFWERESIPLFVLVSIINITNIIVIDVVVVIITITLVL